MSKKVLALLTAAVMLLPLFTACTQPAAPAADKPAPAASAETAPAANEKPHVNLQTTIVETDFMDAWEDSMKPAFEEEYPWITLEVVAASENKYEYHTTHAATGDLPPVMQTDAGQAYHEMADEGLLLDLSKTEAAAHIPQSYKDAYTYNGVLYGLTQGAAFDALFVNMAILKKAGWDAAPTCWDEFIQCCADVKAKGYEAVTVAGGKNTTMWMPFETIVVNTIGDELGAGVYEEQIRAGKLDLAAYPEIAARLDQIAEYMMEGSTQYSEDDVTAIMTEGNCAMAIAGNWTANNICNGIATVSGDITNAVMIAPPFNDAGKTVWLSATPESAFGMAKVDDPNVAEARNIFFEWIFKPENFKWIQNARGTLPVLDNMTPEQIVLPDAVKAFSAASQSANTFSMSFNNVSDVVNQEVQRVLAELFSGNADGAATAAAIQELYTNDPLIK